MRNLFYLFFCGLSLFGQVSPAQNGEKMIETQAYYNSQGQKIELEAVFSRVRPGDVIVIGENHGQAQARQQQLEVLHHLRTKGFKVSLGMEFFTYTDQELVNLFMQKKISEEDFLNQINWGQGFPFSFYRDQVLSQNRDRGELTIALNAPRTITGQVAKKGLESLSPEQEKLLPPNLTLGNDLYRQRFIEQMPHLPNPETADRYFAAQSIWDDTMAWKIQQFMTDHSDQVLVVIVGDFHVQYGGGVPDRISSRSGRRPFILSYQSSIDLSQEELNQLILPHPVFGSRADFIWVAE